MASGLNGGTSDWFLWVSVGDGSESTMVPYGRFSHFDVRILMCAFRCSHVAFRRCVRFAKFALQSLLFDGRCSFRCLISKMVKDTFLFEGHLV